MPFISRMKIGARLGAGFAVVIFAGLAVAAYGRFALADISTDVNLLAEDRMVKVDQLGAIKDNLNLIALAARNIAMLDDEAAMAAEKKRIEKARAVSGELLKKLEESVKNEKGKAMPSAMTGALVAWGVTRSITRPMGQAIGAASRIREGDLTGDLDSTSRHETGQLLAAMRDMQASLVKVVGDVRGNSKSVATASG